MITWSWDEIKAAGKHGASYIAGAVSFAVAAHFISQSQGAGITENVNSLIDGLMQVGTAIAGLIGIVTPIYTSWKAAHNASPAVRLSAVAAMPKAVVNANASDATKTAIANKVS